MFWWPMRSWVLTAAMGRVLPDPTPSTADVTGDVRCSSNVEVEGLAKHLALC